MGSIDRRQFLQRMAVLGGGALATAAFLSLLSCSKEETPELPGDNTTPTDNTTPPDSTPPTDNTTPPDETTPPDDTSPPDDTTPPDDDGDDTSPSDDTSSRAYLAVARGSNPSTLVQKAIDALGGIGRFVNSGDNVIIKPNICVANRAPEYAATTNPEVVAALVSLCLGAGAKRVRVMDYPFSGTAGEAYETSGIAAAVEAAGGEMEAIESGSMKFQDTLIPNGKSITSCRIYQDILKADVLINVPIAKHHDAAVLTLGMKNLLGVVENRSTYHTDMAERVTDLTSLVKPDLTVVDAIRILTDNGPSGGDYDDVKLMNTVIASHDIVAADSYAATLFGKTARDVPIVYAGARRGLGTMNLSRIKIEEIAA